MGSSLNYETPSGDNRVRVDHLLDGGVEITIASERRHFSRLVANAGEAFAADILGFILYPFYLVALALFASSKPRGIIRIDRNEVFVEERLDDGFGWSTSTHTWPRRRVTEFRANRFSPAMYFRVAGSENMDLLQNLPAEVIENISAAINSALHELREADVLAQAPTT